MATKTDSGLDLEQVAESAMRVLAHATGGVPEWDRLGLEEQAGWYKFARGAEQVLLKHEGAAAATVAREIFAAWWEAMGRTEDAGILWFRQNAAFRLAWQAVTRHLLALFDADEIEDLGALESSWGPWVQSKLTPTEQS